MMFVNSSYIYRVKSSITTEKVNVLPATLTIIKIINPKIKVTKTSGMFVLFYSSLCPENDIQIYQNLLNQNINGTRLGSVL